MNAIPKNLPCKLYLLILLLLISITSIKAQLTGTFTIPGVSFPTIKSAIVQLNSTGVGSGGVTFNVTAGYSELFTSCTDGMITTTGTAANPIVFQKSDSGANPIITAGAGTGYLDGIIILAGTDYITFDGIDVRENLLNTTSALQMEWGFALLKKNNTPPFNGCQYVVIKNCEVTLNKTNIATQGVHIYSHTPTDSTLLGLTNPSDGTSFNILNNVKVQNSYSGIALNGLVKETPEVLYDWNNLILNCSIQNFGGAAADAYGIKSICQENLTLINNTINNISSGGIAHGGTIYGIMNSSEGTSSFTARLNTISLMKGNNSGYIFGLCNTEPGNIILNHNTLTNFSSEGGIGIVYFIYNSTGINTTTVVIDSNSIGNSTQITIARLYGIFNINNCTGNSAEIIANNNISNINAFSSESIYGLFSSSGNLQAKNIYKNNILNITNQAGSGYFYGIMSNSLDANNVYLNNIGNFSGAGNIYGIKFTTNKSGNIYSNNVFSVSGNGSPSYIYGIHATGGTSSVVVSAIYKNKISDLNATSANGTSSGIYINSGAKFYIYNNFISDLKSPAALGTNAINGIYLSNATTISVCYNTVFLNALSSTTMFGSSGIYSSTNINLDLRNNSLINMSEHKGSGLTVAYRRSSTVLGSYQLNSNANNYYAGTSSTNNLIYYDGTNSMQTIVQYKTFVAPRDAISVSENVHFINTSTVPYDLHINSSTPTSMESGGVPITAPLTILDDYDEDVRNISAPDIGADEFDGVTADLLAPVINYTELPNTSSTSARTLIAIISDSSGIPVSGIGLPRLFWKKNEGSFIPVTSVYIGSNKYSFTFGAGTTGNDSIKYYIVAQDNALTPNVGIYPSGGALGLTANPPAAATPPNNASSYKILFAISGTFNIPGDYNSLTQAAADISSKEITGNVTLALGNFYNSSSETFPIIFTPNTGSGPTHLLTIKPAANVDIVISCDTTIPAIQFKGFKYAVIEGSNNGTTSRNMTIANSNYGTGAGVIHILSMGKEAGAAFITIKNCILINNNTGIRIEGDDNDNIIIQNNLIKGGNYGIYQYSAYTGLTDNLKIISNTIGPVSFKGIYLCGAAAPNIEKNEISNIINTSLFYPLAGIDLSNGVSYAVISGNKIYDIINTGHDYLGTAGAIGIQVSGITNCVKNEIINNIIYSIKTTKNTGQIIYFNNPCGIRIDGGNEHKIYYNSVYLTGTDQLSTYPIISAAVRITGSVDIRNNALRNSFECSTPGSKSYAIYSISGNQLLYSDNNDYYCSGSCAMLGYVDGDRETLAQLQIATGQDLNSKALDPLFIRYYDLRIDTGSPLLTSAVPIPGITIDFKGYIRSTVSPTIGAYEQNISLPVISYSVLHDSFSGYMYLNNVIITDPDGIAGGTFKPRIYFKGNSGGWSSSAAINNVSPYQFRIYTGTFAPGDSVRYYIVAQDILGDVNAVPREGFDAANVNTILLHPTNPNVFKILLNPHYGGGTIANGGYFFANSTHISFAAPSHPEYQWNDPIVLEHSLLTLWDTDGDDGVSTALLLPFTFKFFDSVYTSIYACANGWVSFRNSISLSDSIRHKMVPIPTAGGIENYIAAVLSNLDVRTSIHPDAHVYFGNVQNDFAITFMHAYKKNSETDYLTFQIIFKPYNNIRIQFNKLESSAGAYSIINSSTTGIENYNGTKGVQYRYNNEGGPLLDTSSIAVEFGKIAGSFPVELSSFSAAVNGRNITLRWETKTEMNFNYFQVEHSFDSKTWNTIGEVKAKGTSTEPVEYSFTDMNLNSGKVNYRLRMIDLDGSEKLSKVIEAAIGIPYTFNLSQNYPNPFNPLTKIQYQLPVAAKVTIELFTITGEKVIKLVNAEQEPGYYTLDINSNNNFSSGVYIYRIIAVNNITGNTFVDVKKMMMLK